MMFVPFRKLRVSTQMIPPSSRMKPRALTGSELESMEVLFVRRKLRRKCILVDENLKNCVFSFLFGKCGSEAYVIAEGRTISLSVHTCICNDLLYLNIQGFLVSHQRTGPIDLPRRLVICPGMVILHRNRFSFIIYKISV